MGGAADEVSVWLRSLGLGQYEATFRDNKIDVDVLTDLTDGDQKALGLPLGDRKRPLRAIAEFGAHEALPAQARRALTPPASALQSFAQLDSIERHPIDLVGSTKLATALDVEDWRNLLSNYLDEASKALTGLAVT